MNQILDTDFCVAWVRDYKPAFEGQFQWADVGISIITVAELYAGAAKSHRPEENYRRARALAERCRVIGLDDGIVLQYAEIAIPLERAGMLIPDFDILIGATALTIGVPLVTNNVRHMERIPGLRLILWARAG